MTRKSRAFRLLAAALAASVIAPGLAIAGDEITNSNTLTAGPYCRGKMGLVSSPISSPLSSNVEANGHGSATIEVYDQNNVLLGTVTSPLPISDSPNTTYPAVTVSFHRVTSGNDACTTMGSQISCDVYVPEPDSKSHQSSWVTEVASLRGTVTAALLGDDDITGQGYCEETYKHKVDVYNDAPPPPT